MAKHFGNTEKIESLLAAIQAGDDKAREELIRESQERLRRLASIKLKEFPGVARMAGQTDDVLQPALFRLYRALEKKKFDSGRAFILYAAKSIHRELLDLVRKHRREVAARITNRPDADGRAPLDRVGKLGPEPGVLTESDRWYIFQEAVEQLPENEKQVFELRCYGKRSVKETAVILGIAEKTVTRRYGRATEKLGAAVQGAFGDR